MTTLFGCGNQTPKKYKVFIYNETAVEIRSTQDLIILPGEFKILELSEQDTLQLNIGAKFMFNNAGLEIVDLKSQVSGLGGDFLVKYGVPDEAEYAFVIVPPGQGD